MTHVAFQAYRPVRMILVLLCRLGRGRLVAVGAEKQRCVFLVRCRKLMMTMNMTRLEDVQSVQGPFRELLKALGLRGLLMAMECAATKGNTRGGSLQSRRSNVHIVGPTWRGPQEGQGCPNTCGPLRTAYPGKSIANETTPGRPR